MRGGVSDEVLSARLVGLMIVCVVLLFVQLGFCAIYCLDEVWRSRFQERVKLERRVLNLGVCSA